MEYKYISEYKLICEALNKKDISILRYKNLDSSYFFIYKDIYDYCIEIYKELNELPTLEFVVNKFSTNERPLDILVEEENIDILYNDINKNYLSSKIIKELSNVLKDDYVDVDPVEAGYELIKRVSSIISGSFENPSYDKIDRFNKEDKPAILKTGWDYIDKRLDGLYCGAELVVIYARTGVGKSFFTLKILSELFKGGYNVGFISPEMEVKLVSYRIDAILKQYKISELMKGIFSEDYKTYIKELSNCKNKFYISDLSNFGNKLNIDKIDNYIIINKLDCLCIDGIGYIKSRLKSSYNSTAEHLEDVARGLMELSSKHRIPILVTAQSNRETYGRGELVSDLRTIRGSDAISHISSRAIGLGSKDNLLIAQITKNRYGRVKSEADELIIDLDEGLITYSGEYKGTLENKSERVEVKKEDDEDVY